MELMREWKGHLSHSHLTETIYKAVALCYSYSPGFHNVDPNPGDALCLEPRGLCTHRRPHIQVGHLPSWRIVVPHPETVNEGVESFEGTETWWGWTLRAKAG